DIEECQIQVVATKPVARWQIWLGKWLGIVSLNAALLMIAGAGVYGLLQWRASRLPVEQQKALRNEVLISRGSARERDLTGDIETETDRLLAERLKQNPVTTADVPNVRGFLREQVRASFQTVPPSYDRRWQIDLGDRAQSLRGQPLQLRIKFNTAEPIK